MSKPVIIMFGGISPEHEVSIITGLQVVESIDRSVYDPHAIYVTKQGQFQYLPGLNTRKGFLSGAKKEVSFGRDDKGGYVQTSGFTGKKIYPHAAYLAFHGGNGEAGGVQGMLDSFGIPFTSTGRESATITMNKLLTKQEVAKVGVPGVRGKGLFATQIRADVTKVANEIIMAELSLPVIIKPTHLGSSIGITVAKTDVELEKYLLEAAFIDSEILVESYLTGFTEYNCAVRLIDGKLEASEIEKPMSKDEILSFADKYQRGGKKTGGDGGMASLQRELPAKISADLKAEIQEKAKAAFIACRCKGMVRIDFMVTSEGEVLLTEINPIPGSMAFYLWEATGIPFKQQITDLIEQGIRDAQASAGQTLDYHSDIVEKFVAQ